MERCPYKLRDIERLRTMFEVAAENEHPDVVAAIFECLREMAVVCQVRMRDRSGFT